ncbi:MAG: hypothetical protein COB12_11935 [Flavobacterium sp.]|nr:MAG: hypothetical protein COB12_11935 [Flavobacterium sp.]
MAFQLINVGAVANDRTGDTWRDAFVKVNSNLTELFDVVASIGIVFVNEEADFPVQDGTTITLETQIQYIITAPITTAKSFTVQNAAVLTSSSTLGPLLTYTGTGAMFNIIDASFVIRLMQLDHPNAQGYNFVDTSGGTFVFLSDNVRHLTGTKYGTFNDAQTVLIQVGAAFSMAQGIEFLGTNMLINSIDKLFIGSTSTSFKAIDLGSSVSQTTEFRDVTSNAPSGAFGISGLINSGNIPIGRLAMINNCEFGGGMTSLENITNEDVRYRFRDNTPIPDTIEDALLSFNGSSTETTISTQDVPVIVNATWTCIRESFFACTTGGRITFLGERDVTLPIDVHVGLISAGGGSINVTVYLAKNGSVITASATSIAISGSNQALVGIPWQDTMTEDDFYEIFVENNSNTTNIIVESGKLRVA